MTSESIPLGQLIREGTRISYGIVQPGMHVEEGVKFVQAQDVAAANTDVNSLSSVEPEIAAGYPRTQLEGGELLVTVVGVIGGSIIAPPEFAGANVSRSVAVIRLDPKHSAKWVNIVIQSHYGQWFLNTYCNTSVQKTLNLSDLAKLPIPFPPEHVIEKIVSNISDFDDLNTSLSKQQHINKELISALFRSWFIDFDPVKAKSDGKLPYGMDEETAALFPDTLENSELGPIPTDWKWGQLGDCISVVGGGTPSTKNEEFWGGKYNWTSPKDLSNSNSIIMLDTERTITEEGLAKVSSGLLPKNTVLMSSRAPIGYLALAKIPVAINQGYIAIPPKNSMSPNFMLSWINYNMPLIEAYSSGSTFPEISKKEFRKLPILIPSVELIEKFNEETTRLYDSIETSLKQMNSLINTRDALLPRLMSGELKVPTEA